MEFSWKYKKTIFIRQWQLIVCLINIMVHDSCTSAKGCWTVTSIYTTYVKLEQRAMAKLPFSWKTPPEIILTLTVVNWSTQIEKWWLMVEMTDMAQLTAKHHLGGRSTICPA